MAIKVGQLGTEHSVLGFQFVLGANAAGVVYDVVASTTLSMTTSADVIPDSAQSSLTLSDSANVELARRLVSTLTLSDSSNVTVRRDPDAESDLTLSDAVGFILISPNMDEVLCNYAPFVGGGIMPATLDGPDPGITDTFALIFPASGSPTDTVVLRAPDLGNKDRLGFDRINRETRGGTLVVFADPDWPKMQTLALNFSALCPEDAAELLRFMLEHIGEEIKLTDWEQRAWRGLIMTPDEPVIQDGKHSFSASFEFEGELI